MWEEGIQVGYSSLSEWKRWSWEFGRPRRLVFTGWSTREERAAQRECYRGLQRIFCKPSAEYCSAHEILQPREKPPKKFQRSLTEANPGLAIVSVPTCQNGKSYNLQANGKNSQRVLAPQGAKFLLDSIPFLPNRVWKQDPRHIIIKLFKVSDKNVSFLHYTWSVVIFLKGRLW